MGQSDEPEAEQKIYRSVVLTLIHQQLEKMTDAELLRLIGRLDAAGYWH